jgi:hypothetical protein
MPQPLSFFSYEAKMTMKLLKASVGLVGVLSLFACAKQDGNTENPGTAGGSAGVGSAGSGSGQSGSGGTPTAGTSGAAGNPGVAGGTAGSGAAGTGAAGTGAAGTTGAGGAIATDDSVLERGKNPSRTGNYVQPTLTTAAAKGTGAMKVMPDTAFNTNAAFASPTTAMYSSPLYLANGPGGKGIFIAATTNNDVKAFDDTGTLVWTRSLTNPTSGGALSPKGIMGTPVIDPTLGPDQFATIYACAPAAPTMGGKMDRYELHAMSAKDGTERAGWPAKLDNTVKATNDGLTRAFNPVVEAQRPALSLVNGIVYIGFGGPFGDFGSPYYGWVIAVDTKSPTTIGAWSTRLEGDAIWSPGGFASDGNGVIITTGNYFAGSYMSPPTWGDNEAVIRLTGMPSALTRSDAYHPARWAFMDTNDQDLGSSSVMLLKVPGATPANYAVTVSKDSHLYFLDSTTLGTMDGGGEIIDLTLSPSNHSARTSPVTYTTADGTIHLAITIDRGPYNGCPATTPAVAPGLAILMGLTVTPGSPVKVTQDWCTNVGGPAQGDQGTVRNRSASPLVTTVDGTNQPILWVGGSTSQTAAGTSANMLYGVDGVTGAVLYSGGNCTGIRQWTTPIAVKGHIVLGGDGHLCSWSAQ